MLTPIQQSSFVEKVFTDRAGRQFRMVFLVALVDGEVKGRLISVEQIHQLKGFTIYDSRFTNNLLCLPCSSKTKIATPLKSYILNRKSRLSPYNELFFFTSQPTRAPSFK